VRVAPPVALVKSTATRFAADYIDKHNSKPKPSVWTAKADEIFENVKRAHTALDNG
jgi:hypothetical protein